MGGMNTTIDRNFYQCTDKRGDAELFVVEGQSAAGAVARLRRVDRQAVWTMQGKPMNAVRANPSALQSNLWYRGLVRVMTWQNPRRPSATETEWDGRRDLSEQIIYRNIVVLMDPDADGMHCEKLLCDFFRRFASGFVAAERLHACRPPAFQIESIDGTARTFAQTPEQLTQIRQRLDQSDVEYHVRRYRGLAGIQDEVLVERCLDPTTRRTYVVR